LWFSDRRSGPWWTRRRRAKTVGDLRPRRTQRGILRVAE
jgi:hypothetical protein